MEFVVKFPYVKENIFHRPMHLVNLISVEMAFDFIATFLCDISTIVVAVDRPNLECKDFSLFIERMNFLLEYLFTFKADIILCGDFNVNFMLVKDLDCVPVPLNSVFPSFNVCATSEVTSLKLDRGSCLDSIVIFSNSFCQSSNQDNYIRSLGNFT